MIKKIYTLFIFYLSVHTRYILYNISELNKKCNSQKLIELTSKPFY